MAKVPDRNREKEQHMDGVTDISGRGLMIGFKISGRDSADVVQEALGKGLMMLTAKDRIRLLPPLVITYDEIDAGLKILENCI